MFISLIVLKLGKDLFNSLCFFFFVSLSWILMPVFYSAVGVDKVLGLCWRVYLLWFTASRSFCFFTHMICELYIDNILECLLVMLP